MTHRATLLAQALVAVAVVACHPVERIPTPAPEPDRLLLRAQIARELPGIRFGLVAELVRGDKRAAVLWPAIRDGRIIDDDIVGRVYVKDAAGWRLERDGIGLSRSRGRAALEQALGGPPEAVVRRCGVARADMAAHLERWPRAFADARAAGRDDEALRAYEELARAFPLEVAAYDDMLSEWLIKAAAGKVAARWRCDDDGCALQAQEPSGQGTRSVMFPFQRCGDGWVVVVPPPKP